MMDKRGISPLIATVLIVGMTIAIAATIFVFLKGQTELIAKKGETKFSANEEVGVDFQVLECKNADNKLELKLKNTGKQKIDCFWIATTNNDPTASSVTKLSVFNMKEGEEDTLKLNVDNVEEVDMYPCLIEKNKVKTGTRVVSAVCEA